MDKAKEILHKHTKSANCRSDLMKNPFLEQAVLNAINEALRIHDVVGRSEQLCRTFLSDGTTSSATKCRFCGKEKWEH